MAEVRRAGPGDVQSLAEMLAHAFGDDAVAHFLFPDAVRRERALIPFFALQLRHVYLPRGEVYTTSATNAAALWLGPSPQPVRIRDAVAHLASLPMLGNRLLIIRQMTQFLARCHPVVPHYYLGTLGTDPSAQRQGIASSLLRPVLEHCDAAGTLAYLECSTLHARAFYEKHGFYVTQEVQVPAQGPWLWLMQRQPRVS